MTFIINAKPLKETLAVLTRVLATKNPIQILDCCRVEVKESGDLTLTCSDNDNTLTRTLKVAETDGECLFCIKAKDFAEAVKTMPDTPVTFDCEDKQVTLDYKKGRISLPAIDANEYPLRNGAECEGNERQIESKRLAYAITATSYAVSYDTVRPVMTGVLWDFGDGSLTLAASDTHKLAYCKVPSDNVGELKLIVPKSAMDIIAQLLTGAESVSVGAAETAMTFTTDTGYFLVSKLIRGKYPNYLRVFPNKEVLGEYKTTSAELGLALKRVGIGGNQDSNLVVIEFGQFTSEIKANDLDMGKSAAVELDGEFEGTPFRIGMKKDLLEQISKSFSGRPMTITFFDPCLPAVVTTVEMTREYEWKALLMPMHIPQ